MSQTKAQLISPVGVVTTQGVVVTGVMTAGSFDGNFTGTATSIISGSNLNVGTFTAGAGFSGGDFTGTATGIKTGADIKVGSFTATSFIGDFTGTATSMMRGTGFEAGTVTASSFEGNVTGNVTGSITGLAGSVISGGNIHIGVMTATSYSGDGSNLTGIGQAHPFIHQTVTANSGATTIDLTAGNCITFNQSADTTISFANTYSSMDVTLIRKKDDTSTVRTITWPDSVKWTNNTIPILINSESATEYQQFQFITRDSGVTWYGWENAYDPVGSSLYTWGSNEYGLLGLNDTNQYSVGHKSSPTQLSGGKVGWDASISLRSRSAYNGSTLIAGKTDGTLWAWGRNTYGQLGQNRTGNNSSRSSPVQIPGTTWYSMFNNSDSSTAGYKTDGTLWVWGRNYFGMLGLNEGGYPGTNHSSPTQLGTDNTWAKENGKMGSAYRSIMAIKTDGTLWAWGSNEQGRLGLNEYDVHKSSPTQVPGTTWDKVIGGFGRGAIKTDGTLWTWGANFDGILGLNQRTIPGTPYNDCRSSPTQIPGTWQSMISAVDAVAGFKSP